jgi:hypothetical protein
MMTDPNDLREKDIDSLELAAYSDGTADISLGLVFLLLGFFSWSREMLGATLNMVVFLLAIVVLVGTLQLLRNRLVIGRIGEAEFSPPPQKSKRVFILITALIVVGMIAIWILTIPGWSTDLPVFLRNYGFPLVVALVMLGMFSAAAFFLDLPRYYLYGVLLAAGVPAQFLLTGIYEGAPFITAGLIITGIGVWMFTRFLKAFPAQKTEES